MRASAALAGVFAIAGAAVIFSQNPPPAAPRTGPGVQAPQDAKYPDLLKTCKTAPPARGGQAKGGGGKGGPPGGAPPGERDVASKAIPGVIADGQKWKSVWEVNGNNADGIIGTSDGGLLIAQNDNSAVLKLDKNGKISTAYSGTNTGGSVAMNTKGALFVLNRGLNESVEQLAPQRRIVANKYNGDPLDCIGGVVNDLAADSKGGVYFTMGGLFYMDPKGNITRYGENLTTNGIVLTPDEKHVYVTNGNSIAAFDVKSDGSLTNQHEFAKLEAGGAGDGSTFDSAGRLYVTSNPPGNPGVQVFSADGKYLGIIPTPRNIISVAFSGPNRKTLYVVARDNAMNKDWILTIPMIAQGAKGRGK